MCSGDKALKRAPGCSSTKCRLQVYECDIIVYVYPVVVGTVLFDRIKAGERRFDSVLIVLRGLLLKGLKRCFLCVRWFCRYDKGAPLCVGAGNNKFLPGKVIFDVVKEKRR